MADGLILIIEDDALSRKLVRDVLQHQGFVTIEAEDAETGISLAQERRPDLILMDVQLPGMNGIEALQALRADTRTQAIPVIAVTASAMTEDQVRIREAGFNGYQPKPIAVMDFLKTVRRVLARQHDTNSGTADE